MDSILTQPALVPLGDVASANAKGGTTDRSSINCYQNNSDDSAAGSATCQQGKRAYDMVWLIVYLATAFALVSSSQTTAPLMHAADRGVTLSASAAPTATFPSSSLAPWSFASVHRSFSSPRTPVTSTLSTPATGITTVATPHPGITFKPILMEVGAILLLEALGLSVFSKLSAALRRIRWARLVPASRRWLSVGGGTVRVSVVRVMLRQLRFLSRLGSKFYKSLVQMYSRTSASKIVTRAKKLIKVMMLPDEHEHDETEETMKGHSKHH